MLTKLRLNCNHSYLLGSLLTCAVSRHQSVLPLTDLLTLYMGHILTRTARKFRACSATVGPGQQARVTPGSAIQCSLGSTHLQESFLNAPNCVQLLDRVDGVLFLTDSRSSLTAADQDAADWLRKNVKRSSHPHIQSLNPSVGYTRSQHPPQAPQVPIPVTVIANKCDNIGDSNLVASALEAVNLGLGSPVLYSAETQFGTADLYEALQPVIDAAEKKLLQRQHASGVAPTMRGRCENARSMHFLRALHSALTFVIMDTPMHELL